MTMKRPADDSSRPVPHREFEVYEVFAKTTENGTHEHQFSLLAASSEMALTLARENFLRRRAIYGLWVVRRADIVKAPAEETDLFFRLPKPYREVSDYQYLGAKWRQYQQPAMTPDTMA